MNNSITVALGSIISILVGLVLGFIIRKKTAESGLDSAEKMAGKILEDAKKEAENKRKEAELQAKELLYQTKS